MATVNEKMTAIADEIRECTGGTEPLTLDAMAQEIPNVYNAGYEKGKAEGGIDWSEYTDFAYFSYFNNRNNLVSQLKYEDTRNGTHFDYMFTGCDEFVELPDIDTSKGTVFSGMFEACAALEIAPRIDTSKGEDFENMFRSCPKLTTIPELDLSNCSTKNRYSVRNIFAHSRSIMNIGFKGTIYVGDRLSLDGLPNLTVETLISFLTALEDRTGLSTITVTIGSTNIAKLSNEQLQIAYDKNITLA